MRERKHYESPATMLVRVELESNICAGSEVHGADKDNNRHVNINQQENGGSVDFTNSGNTWD